ncbi:YcxB family protein [Asticcacaulis taihuensis]|uniref:YcxB family protein n=1 Tax=Asticcacaulis taihuensis TaxID=260084 RepID=UPI0026EB95BA|nr:YcxB family protein [Asticcacaulis taihuensis]
MRNDNLTITGYRISAATYNSFFAVYLRRNLLRLPRFLWACAYTLLLMLITASMHHFKVDVWDIITMSIFSFVTIYVLIPFGAYFVGIIQFTTGKMPKVSHALSITEEAVTKSSPLATVTVPWSALHAVDQSKRTIFFFTNRSCAIMIPKSAFASQQAAQDFLSAAKAYWQQARV